MISKVPKVLYHGTTTLHLEGIIRDGLIPRSKSGHSNWEHSAPSNPDAVYLTQAYGMYYAHPRDRHELPLVLEIDTTQLDPTKFGADEDAVAGMVQPTEELQKMSLIARSLYWREHVHKLEPEVSLNVIGNCTYFGDIPPCAITRGLTLTIKEFVRLTMMAFDPTITVTNYRLFGKKYNEFNAWLFGQESKEYEHLLRPECLPRPLEQLLEIA